MELLSYKDNLFYKGKKHKLFKPNKIKRKNINNLRKYFYRRKNYINQKNNNYLSNSMNLKIKEIYNINKNLKMSILFITVIFLLIFLSNEKEFRQITPILEITIIIKGKGDQKILSDKFQSLPSTIEAIEIN